MRPILLLLRKDFVYFRRDRGALLLTFIVPFALIYLFGQIFGVNRTESGPSAIPVAVVDESGKPIGAQLVAALKRETTFRVITETAAPKGGHRPLTEADLRPMMQADDFHFAVVLPPDLVGGDAFGVHLRFLSDPRNPMETQTVNGLLQKTIFLEVPQLLGSELQSAARRRIGEARSEQLDREIARSVASAYGLDENEVYSSMRQGNLGFPQGGLGSAGDSLRDGFSRLIRIDNEQVVGRDVRKPAATQLVGGWAMQFLLFALMASANSLFYEKDQGLFRRLLSGPVSKSDVLWSKFLYGTALGLLQLLILFLAGQLLFGINVLPQVPALALVSVFAAASCSAFGMLLAAVSKTPEMGRGLATFLILLMSAIGGAWFPVSFMPEFMQHLSRFTLVYWSIRGFLQVLWEQAPLLHLLPTIGILAGMTALLLGVAWWRFERGEIFD